MTFGCKSGMTALPLIRVQRIVVRWSLRYHVIVGWPVLLIMDVLLALLADCDYKAQRKWSNQICADCWNWKAHNAGTHAPATKNP